MSYRNVFYYDSRRNLTCVRDSDLGLTYYTYDAGSRMTSVQNPFGEVSYYEYRLDNQVKSRVLGNGCVTYYEYDNIGRTSRVENRKGDGSMISSFDYARDAVGNPISIEREDGYTVYYEYDAKHQLTRETHVDEGDVIYAWEWDYDAAGNREHQVFNGEATYYEYNAANELITETKGGEVTYYQYDRCGNTTAKQELAGTTYYYWDYENLLTQIDLPDGAHNYFAYDADGKHVSERDSEGFTEFIYQGPNMLALQLERDEAGETQVQYTMGAGLESMRRGEASSFYHYDWLGSTHELTDAEQAVTDTYLYNAWGEVLERTGETENPHTYDAKSRYYEVIPSVLYYVGKRHYAADIARFLSRDLLASILHKFRYCSSRPSVSIDPTGLGEYVLLQPGMPSEPPNGWIMPPQNETPDPVRAGLCAGVIYGTVDAFRAWGCNEAADHLEHFLGQTGTDYWIDMNALVTETMTIRRIMWQECTDALHAVQSLRFPRRGVTVRSRSKQSARISLWEDRCWLWAVGRYKYWGVAVITCDTVTDMRMRFQFRLKDLYDFPAGRNIPGQNCAYYLQSTGLATPFFMQGLFDIEVPLTASQCPTEPFRLGRR